MVEIIRVLRVARPNIFKRAAQDPPRWRAQADHRDAQCLQLYALFNDKAGRARGRNEAAIGFKRKDLARAHPPSLIVNIDARRQCAGALAIIIAVTHARITARHNAAHASAAWSVII
jgi:hypothetical protein